jgi:hypothetical protein
VVSDIEFELLWLTIWGWVLGKLWGTNNSSRSLSINPLLTCFLLISVLDVIFWEA